MSPILIPCFRSHLGATAVQALTAVCAAEPTQTTSEKRRRLPVRLLAQHLVCIGNRSQAARP